MVVLENLVLYVWNKFLNFRVGVIWKFEVKSN